MPAQKRFEALYGCLWLGFFAVPVSFVSANPLGEMVRHGDVQFERLPGHLKILQGSDKAIIDWEAFSIGGGELTEFVQPDASSAALNRVRGLSASRLDGALRANGRVFLLNPNGIVIGPGGTIDVGGFVASTLDIPDQEFLSGGDLNFKGSSDATIVNLGRISALDGDVFLIAASVDNAGTIRAPNGTVGLAAGNDVLLTESGEERVFVRGASGETKAVGVSNSGAIEANIAELKAHGGNIYGMAIRNEGRIAATGITNEGGQVFLRASGGLIRNEGTVAARRSDGSGGRITVDAGEGGKIEEAGTLDAKGETGAGGEIVLIGSEIDVLPGALILADGETQGGTVQIGGDSAQGEVAATRIDLAAGSLVSVGSQAGPGGGIRVLGGPDSTVNMNGELNAASDGDVGGSILVQGSEIGLGSLALLNASGFSGGGAVLVGGGARGEDPSIMNAENVTVAQGAQIRADAIGTGNGGQVVVLANQRLDFGGQVSAIGGAGGGKGGFVELSGKNEVLIPSLSGQVKVSSTSGSDGTLLVDPVNGGVYHAASGSSGNLFSDGEIQSFLAGGNFILETNSPGTDQGNISVDPDVNITWNSGNNLTFNAVNDFVMRGGSTLGATFHAIDPTGGGPSGSVNVNAGRSIWIEENASILTGGGSINLSANQEATPVTGNFSGIGVQNAVLQTTSGDIVMAGRGGTAMWNRGIDILGSNARVETFYGDIEIAGVGGAGSSGANPGVIIRGGATILSSGAGVDAGEIRISGTGGNSSGNDNWGASLQGSTVRVVDGSIVISGQGGGTGAGSANYGVFFDGFDGPTLIESTGTGGNAGAIEIVGTGGNGVDINGGIWTVRRPGESSITIRTAEADLTLRGQGGAGTGEFNHGVDIQETVSILSTGTGNDAATISIIGTGGSGSMNNNGVVVAGRVESEEGAILIEGVGGTGSGGQNHGVGIFENAVIRSNGISPLAATITIDGTGGTMGSDNRGIYAYSSSALITSEYGDISLAGRSSAAGVGVSLSGVTVESTGSGSNAATITIDGEAETAGGTEFGVHGVWLGEVFYEDLGGAVTITPTTIRSDDGEILIDGNALGTGTDAHQAGIWIHGAEISSTGNAPITIQGRSEFSGNLSTATGVQFCGSSWEDSGGAEYRAYPKIHTVDGNVLVMGDGIANGEGSEGVGVALSETDIIASGTASITIDGDGMAQGNESSAVGILGNTWDTWNTHVSTTDGNVTFLGNAEVDSGWWTTGVQIDGDVTVESTGSGKIHIEGRGTGSWDGNAGVQMWARVGNTLNISTQSGDIDVIGHGSSVGGLAGDSGIWVGAGVQFDTVDGNIDFFGRASGAQEENSGVWISGAKISSTGTGSGAGVITIDGAAEGTGGAGFNTGVYVGVEEVFDEEENEVIAEIPAEIRTVDGGIVIKGQVGSTSAGDENLGVAIEGAFVASAGTGAIHIEGTGGGDGSGEWNTGVYLGDQSSILSTGAGPGAATLTIIGTGGSGTSNNAGVEIEGQVESVDGAILIDGVGGAGTGDENVGSRVWDLAIITSTGTSSNAATITVKGAAGSGVQENEGIQFFGTVTSGYGNIVLEGTGGTGSGEWNSGVTLAENASVLSTGLGADAATISIKGMGGSGTEGNLGVGIMNDGKVESVDGAIFIEGVGGAGSGGSNIGVGIYENAVIRSEGIGPMAATITVDGTGGIGTDENSGIVFYDGGTVQSADGAIHFEGTGGGSSTEGERNRGIWSGFWGTNGGTVRSTGDGSVTIIGTGGMGNNEIDGIQLENGTLVEVNNGALSLTGAAGGTLGIGVIGTNTTGSVRSVGTGSVSIIGTGTGGAAGVDFQNPGATIGGAAASSVWVESKQGAVNLNTPIGSGGGVDVLGNTITVRQQVDAAGTIAFTIDDKGTATDGRVAINSALNAGAGPATFTGGTGTGDTVDFSGFVGPALTVSAGQLNSVETLIGPPGTTDTLEGSATGDVFTTTGPNSGTVVAGESNLFAFSSFENLRSLGGDDQFTFRNQATIDGIADGGPGYDVLTIDDSDFAGGGVYTIGPNQITRNPVYYHANFELLQLLAGSGNDTVNSSFLTGISQYLYGGSGSDTLHLAGATFPGPNPIYGPAGTGGVSYYNFEFLFPQAGGNPDPGDPGDEEVEDPGGEETPGGLFILGGDLLQIQVDLATTHFRFEDQAGFEVFDYFGFSGDSGLSGGGPSGGMRRFGGIGIAAQLTGAGQSFPASGAGGVFGLSSGQVIFGVSLDGSGAIPSDFVRSLIAGNLRIFSWTELSQALGGLGEAPVMFFDGIVALDGSGAGAPPVVVGLIGLNLGPSAQSELSLALGGTGSALLESGQGGQAILLDGTPLPPAVVALLQALLGENAMQELQGALR